MKAPSRVRKLFINHPAVDYVVAACGVLAYLIVRSLWGEHFPAVDPSRRAVLLQTLSGVAVAVLGVSVTAVAIIASVAPRPRVAALVRAVSDRLGAIIIGSLMSLGVIALAFAGLIALDNSDRIWPWATAAGLAALLVARSGRLMWILAQLFVATAADDGEPRTVTLPPVDTIDPTKYTLEEAQRVPPPAGRSGAE